MLNRRSIGAAALAAMLSMGCLAAQAQGLSKYPDWNGAWARFNVPGLGGQPSFDQTKPWGCGQQAPLTAEYQRFSRTALPTRPRAARAIFSTTASAACPRACRS